MVHDFAGELLNYSSVDSAMSEDEAIHFLVEFLNSLEVSGLPPHTLSLKFGIPIIILRSLDPPHVTNGTRSIVTRLFPNVVHHLAWPIKGENSFTP